MAAEKNESKARSPAPSAEIGVGLAAAVVTTGSESCGIGPPLRRLRITAPRSGSRACYHEQPSSAEPTRQGYYTKSMKNPKVFPSPPPRRSRP